MKSRTQILFVPLAILFAANLQPLDAPAQGTVFTYQGQLQDNGVLVNGSYDLQFTLYATNGGGSPIAGPVTNLDIPVTNGLFTTLVNFGPGAFTGAVTSNWLDIAVATNGTAAFAELTPRQQLTSVPFAVFAAGANAAGLVGNIAATNIANGTITSNLLAPGSVGAPQVAGGIGLWTQSGTNIGYSTGYAGIGTTNPQAPFEIVGNNSFPQLDVAAGSNAPYGAFLGLDATATTGGQDYLIFSTGGTAAEGLGKLVFKDQSRNIYSFTTDSNGNFGVGTYAPQAALDVHSGSEVATILQSSSIGGTTLRITNSYNPADQASWDMTVTAAGSGDGPGFLSLGLSDGSSPPLEISPNGFVAMYNSYPNYLLNVENCYCNGNTWVNNSDRAMKENFSAIKSSNVLAKVTALPITTWNYKTQTARHLGPMAQDFYAAFGLGQDGKHIATIDEEGVALAAIQGLNQKMNALKTELNQRDA